MIRIHGRWLLVFALVLAWSAAPDGDVQEGAMGRSWRFADAGIPVGTTEPQTCQCGAVIATGVVSGAPHELPDGSAWIGKHVNVSATPGFEGFQHVRAFAGQEVELVIRPKVPRERQELIRP